MPDSTVSLHFRVTDDGTVQVIDQASGKLRAFESQAKTSAAGASSAFASLKTVLAGLGIGFGVVGIVRGLSAIKGAAGDAVRASIEQQNAVKLLDAQLQTSGQFSERYSLKLQAQASALQKVTTVGDETILGLQRQLVAFGATSQNIGRVTEASLDLSAGLGTDAKAAVLLLGKAMAGEFGTLSRYGIFVDENASKTEKLEQALSQIEGRFGGQAQAAANTFGGALKQVSNATGDLNESIGSLITDSPFLIGLLHDARDAAADAAENTAEWVKNNRGLIDQKFDNFVDGLKGIRDTYREIKEALDSLPAQLPFSNTGQSFGQNTLDALLGTPDQRAGALAALGITPFGGGGGFRGSGGGGSFGPNKLGDLIVDDTLRGLDALRNVDSGTGGTVDNKAALAAAKAEARALAEAAKDAADSAQAYVVAQQSGLEVAKAQLDIAGELGASQQEQLLLAQQVDLAEKGVLDAQIGVLGAKIDAVGVAGGELDLLLAQVDALGAQKDIIERTGGEAAKVTREFEEQRKKLLESKQITLDLGRELNTSLQRAVDGILQGGGGQGLDDILKGTGTALASSFIGGLVEAELAKNSFDAKVSENFSVTLPGFMQTGADAISSIWGSAMDFLTGSSDSATRGIGTNFAQLGNQLQGLSRNVPGFESVLNLGPGAATALAQGGTEIPGIGVLNQTDLRAAQQSGLVSDTTTSNSGSGAAALGGIGLALGLGLAFSGSGGGGGNKGRFGVKPIAPGPALTAGQGTAIGASLGTAINPGLGTIIGAALGAIVGGIIESLPGPTFGTLVKGELRDAVQATGLPEQQIFKGGGHRGLRAQQIERAITIEQADAFKALGFDAGNPFETERFDDLSGSVAPATRGFPLLSDLAAGNPEVDALRTGKALGLSTVLFNGLDPNSQLAAVNSANALTNNLLLLNVTAEEADRQLLKLAKSTGVTLTGGLEELNRQLLETRFRDGEDVKRFLASAEGLVELFTETLPPGVDAAAIVMKNFAEGSGLAIANLNEDLERAVQIFGDLQDASDAGLRSGLGAGIQAGARLSALTEQFRSGRGEVTGRELVQASIRATGEFLSPLIDSIRDGMTTAITEGVFDSVKNNPAWDALQERIAGAVVGGDIADIPALIGDVVNASLPALNAAAEVTKQINEQFGITPSALFGAAEDIRGRVEDTRFGALSRRDQESDLRKRLGDVDTQLAILLGDAIPDVEQSVAISKLLRQKGELGFALADTASQRFAPGSRSARIAREQGLSIATEAEQGLDKLGFTITDSFSTVQGSNEQVVNANVTLTGAIEGLTKQIAAGIGTGEIQINIDGGDGLDAQSLGTIITTQLAEYLNSPTGQAQIRGAMDAR